MDSKTFDNGTICASEQSVICDEDQKEEIQKEMERQGAYFLTPEQRRKLGGFILRANGTMNPMIVGRSAEEIARLSGINDSRRDQGPGGARGRCGREHPYSNEKLAPILAFYVGKVTGRYVISAARSCIMKAQAIPSAFIPRIGIWWITLQKGCRFPGLW